MQILATQIGTMVNQTIAMVMRTAFTCSYPVMALSGMTVNVLIPGRLFAEQLLNGR